MSGLLIFAAVVGTSGVLFMGFGLVAMLAYDRHIAVLTGAPGLALLPVALWLAYAAGGA